MKRFRFLCAATLSLVALSPVARGDTPDPDKPFNPYLETDANGIPLVVTHPELAPLSKEEKEAIAAEQAKEAENKDWLMRIYLQKMEARAAAHPTTSDQYMINQLGADKELARLAGMSDISNPDNKTAPTPGHLDTLPGFSDAKNAPHPAANNSLAHTYQFKPLIAPNSIAGVYGLHDMYAPAPGATPIEGSGASEQAAAPKKADQNFDPTDIETPGMVAAKDSGVPNLGSPDLTLDLLPGESISQARIEQAKVNALALPVPMTADQLPHLGNTTNSTTNPAIPVAKIAPDHDNSNVPMPVTTVPVITPAHPPMSNPYDILNR